MAVLVLANCELRYMPQQNAANPGRDWYAAPTAPASGEGTLSKPFTLSNALRSDRIEPGDTLWIRGGVYSGAFVSELAGAPGAPIVVRPYGRERVVLDGVGIADRWKDRGVLIIRGADAQFWNLEVRDSARVRVFPDRTTPPRPIGISVYGQRIKLINPIVHDAGNGIGLWNAGDTDVYGALVFNNGYLDPNPNGHGFYIQNEGNGTTTRVTNSLSFNNFQMGLHGYGEGGTIEGLALDQFVAFNNGAPPYEGIARRDANLFVGPRSHPADRIHIRRSHSYHPPGVAGIGVRLGYTAVNKAFVVRDNYFVGGTQPMVVSQWESTTFEGNTVFATLRAPGVTLHEAVLLVEHLGPGAHVWANNAYYDQSTPENTERRAFGLAPSPPSYRGAFSEWQAASGDWSSRYEEDTPPDQTFVLPNQYEQGRAHIVAYNWSRRPSVTVRLAKTGLKVGQCYEVWDVEDLFGAPVASGRYVPGRALTLTSKRGPAAAPLGWANVVSSTAPEFGVFLVVPAPSETSESGRSKGTCQSSRTE
ncbi:MAG: hypothetical protein EHM55_01660 [Acidobacteria bacterium]|nr:MAG: hypothetical protein EHM55_01660 [Acidobacteriota bacterium]